MAEDDIPESVDNAIEQSVEPSARTQAKKQKRERVYKVVGKSKVPVSKATGNIWKSRLKIAQKAMGDLPEAWSESIRYFHNDQIKHRDGQENKSGNRLKNQRLNEEITETENIVYANVTTMTPALYSRNPKAEITSNIKSPEGKHFATIVERLVNVIGVKKAAPGINLKPKAKRGVVTALLTNRAWIEIGWNFKSDSSEQALQDLKELADRLEKAKTSQEIETIEGEIIALEDTVDILRPSGPFAKFRLPTEVIIDPNAREVDLTDAKWVMVPDFLPTAFIQAKFGQKKKGGKEYQSIYQPSHVLKVGTSSEEGHEEDNFSLFNTDQAAMKDFGFEDEDAFRRAQRTKVWYVWDKVTRRVLLYNDKDWTWPIWVWDDPLRLDRFFPLYGLTYYESPQGVNTRGEVSYYLDQQDAINEMIDEERRARLWARRNVFYNLNLVKKEDAEAVLNGPDGTARGLKLPEGFKLQDVIGSITPPSLQHKELFDKESKYRAVDRISSVGEAIRGGPTKSNVTKGAVQLNAQATNIRIDEKSDQIEDWIGDIYWGIAQLCLMYMPVEQVMELIGPEAKDVWKQMEPDEIRSTLSLEVVGGSTKKPTSAAKKEEALELGQVLGQFVNAAPGTVLKIMLQVMQEAFDEINIREEDWQEIAAEIASASGAGQSSGTNGSNPSNEVPTGAGGGAQSSPANGVDEAALDNLLAKLSPEQKAQVVQDIKNGVPAQDAIQKVIPQQQPPK